MLVNSSVVRKTSVQSNLAKNRIVDLSPLAVAANRFVWSWHDHKPTWVSPKRHLDRFIRFCTAHAYRHRQTQTHRPRDVRHL